MAHHLGGHGSRARIVALVVFVSCVGVAAPSASHDTPGDRRHGKKPRATVLEAVRAVLDDRSRDAVPEREPVVDLPPALAPLADATWMRLETQISSLHRIADALPSRGPAHGRGRAHIRGAIRAAQDGHEWLVRLEPNFAKALSSVADALGDTVKAQQALADRATVAALDEVLVGLVDVGARMAGDGIERARRAGLTGERLDRAIRATRAGLDLAAGGQYALAFDQFGPGVIVGNLPVFSLERYEQNIRDAFATQTIGYQYAIARNGQLVRASANGDTGAARTSDDNPVTPQWAYKEMNIASVSKTITATVLLQLLAERGISDNTSIAAWLPPDWTKGPGIATLTFRQLLQHRSGLNANDAADPYEFDDLEAYVSAGINQADKVFVYQNANFALFRLAIPYLRYGHTAISVIEALLGPFVDRGSVFASLYKDVVREYAFAPTGFIDADCAADDEAPTRLYAFPPAGGPGFANGNWTRKCGSGRWFMSSVELVGFMAHRRFGQTMSPKARYLMDSRFLGWMAPQNYAFPSGLYGIYRSHGGDLTYTDVLPQRGLDACIMEYPNGVQTALLINSIGGNYAYQCAELASAYDNAFILP